MSIVLIVEDEAAIADMLQMVLEDEGYTVMTASNGQEGLTRLAMQPIDVVISDMMMPVLDGIGLCQAMQRHPIYAHIPIILMSAANRRPALTQYAYAAWLAKPFDLHTLLTTLTRILDHRT